MSEKWMTKTAWGDSVFVVDEAGRTVAVVPCGGDEGEQVRRVTLLLAAPKLLAACEASEQCIVDFLELYKHGGAHLVMDEAVKSLRDDALKLTRAAIADSQGADEFTRRWTKLIEKAKGRWEFKESINAELLAACEESESALQDARISIIDFCNLRGADVHRSPEFKAVCKAIKCNRAAIAKAKGGDAL